MMMWVTAKKVSQSFTIGQVCRILLWALLNCSIAASYAKDNDKKEPDTFSVGELMPLAAMLIKDGNHDRAIKTLQTIDLAQEGLDLARYYTLLGMAQMGLEDWASAKDSLARAIANGQADPVIFVYLAQAHYGLKEYQETLATIGRAGDVFKMYPALLEMKMQAHWLLKQYDQAWDALTLAEALFPDNHKFLERRVFYALDLGLYRNAAELGREYLSKSVAKAQDFVAIGNALRLSRQFDEAANILEFARLSYPEHVTIAKVLAHTYLDQGMTHAAAAILDQASQYNPEFIAEAAELYKRAGRFYRALELNAKISDQTTKLKQRLAILIGLKQYEMVINMESGLHRNRLLGDQSVRYALAYAAYAVGDFDKAKKHLGYVKESGLFKQAMELQRLMQECETEKWKCA
ncbi:MAG: tetratricopeptide repeat protein [Methylobacter sp.]